MSSSGNHMAGDINLFANDMRKMINNKDFSDIKFLIGQNRRTIYAHRCILSARCEVFRAMFSDKTQKGSTTNQEIPFVLSDVSADIFLAVLEYIYTHCVTLSRKNAADVLGSSIEYGLDGLRQLCIDFLMNNIDETNACENMQTAVTYRQDALQDRTMSYIEEHTQRVLKTNHFHELSEDALCVILQSDELNVDELDLLHAVKEWATVNSVVLEKPASVVCRRVIQHIRLPLLSPEELTHIEEQNQKDKQLIPVDHLSFAWKCHALKKGEKGNPLTKKRRGTVQRDTHKMFDNL